jgi:hypothetical protein
MVVHPLCAEPGGAEEVQQQQPVHDGPCQGLRSRSRPARGSPAAAARSGAEDAGLGDRERERRRRRGPEPGAAEARRAAAAGRRQAAQQQPMRDQVLPGLGQHLRGAPLGPCQCLGSASRLTAASRGDQALQGLGSTSPCTTGPCRGSRGGLCAQSTRPGQGSGRTSRCAHSCSGPALPPPKPDAGSRSWRVATTASRWWRTSLRSSPAAAMCTCAAARRTRDDHDTRWGRRQPSAWAAPHAGPRVRAALQARAPAA